MHRNFNTKSSRSLPEHHLSTFGKFAGSSHPLQLSLIWKLRHYVGMPLNRFLGWCAVNSTWTPQNWIRSDVGALAHCTSQPDPDLGKGSILYPIGYIPIAHLRVTIRYEESIGEQPSLCQHRMVYCSLASRDLATNDCWPAWLPRTLPSWSPH